MTFGHQGGYAFNEDQRGGHTPPNPVQSPPTAPDIPAGAVAGWDENRLRDFVSDIIDHARANDRKTLAEDEAYVVSKAAELSAVIAAQGRAGDVVPDNVRYWANRVIEETAGIPTECDHEFVGGLHQCEHCGWDSVEFGAVTLARHVIAIPSPTPATE